MPVSTRVHSRLSGLPLGAYKIEIVNPDDINKYHKITVAGKFLGVFGSSPDKSDGWYSPGELSAVHKKMHITDIVLLDSKRLRAYEGLRIILIKDSMFRHDLTDENIVAYYHSKHLNVVSRYQGVDLDLDDGFEMNQRLAFGSLSTLSNSPEFVVFNQSLEQGMSVGDVMKTLTPALQHAARPQLYEAFCRAYDLSDYLEVLQQNIISKLCFYPSKNQLLAFIDCLTAYYNSSSKNPFIHCAGGDGRTSLYLCAFLMFQTKNNAAIVIDYLDKHHYPVRELKLHEKHLNNLVDSLRG